MVKARSSTDKALVVAALNGESVEWTKPLQDEWMVFIERTYHPPGREAWAYFKYICAYYRDLPDTVVLCQGDPYNHAPTFLSDLEDEDKVYFGSLTSRNATGSPQWKENMNEWCIYFDLPEQEEFTFPAGAQYRLSKSNIHNRSEKFYEECFKLADKNDRSGYIFERLLPIIFGLTL